MSQELPPFFETNIPYTIFEAIIGIIAVIGNGIVIFVFSREKNLRTTSNYFIISLALADLLFGLIGIPSAILIAIGQPRNLNLCMFALSTLITFCTISIFCLVGVSIDRYWAILHPLKYIKHSSAKWAFINIGLCWFLGLIVGLLPPFGWYEDIVPNRCAYLEKITEGYLIFYCFVSILIPSTILAIIYALIYKVIHKQISQSKASRIKTMKLIKNNPQEARDKEILRELEKKELKATRNLSMIVIFFVICWLPLNICNVIIVAWPDVKIDETIFQIFIVLSHANSAFNPLLYAYSLKDFRKSFMKNLKC